MDIQLFLILFALGVLIFLYARYKGGIGQELIVAFLIVLGWTSFYHYVYIGNAGYFIGSINILPLVLQTAGFVFLREVYESIQKAYWLRFFYIVVLYWFFLGLLEGLGIYFLGIQTTPLYPSFLGLGILHIPLFAQIYYITIGPIYLLITDYLKVK